VLFGEKITIMILLGVGSCWFLLIQIYCSVGFISLFHNLLLTLLMIYVFFYVILYASKYVSSKGAEIISDLQLIVLGIALK